jgi:cell division protein FtsZ
VQGISEIILTPGLINLDFSDIKAAISGMGHALIGSAIAKGPNAPVAAARDAINSPLLEDTKIKGARQVLMNITASSGIGLHDLNEACSVIREAADCEDLQLSFGVIADDAMGDTAKVTVIATGFAKPADKRESSIEPKPASEFFTERTLDPIPAPTPVIEPIEAGMPMTMASAFDEDLDVPAYLRQGKLLN